MATAFVVHTSRRPILAQRRLSAQLGAQIRHATLLRRPLRPYTFTQLITLSDGSTSVQRTTSPLPLYKTAKDTRNHPLWNPSSYQLANVEEDEAGRLRAFRQRFGRGWDAVTLDEAEGDARRNGDEHTTGQVEDAGNTSDGLLDLISGYGRQETNGQDGQLATSGDKAEQKSMQPANNKRKR
ncbi:MAG: hypothetical protein M1833_005004 [Piccolia ochrophora]|nr:MAG: hypothetical protein M1833_005004 [Piccolia ochrophora]